MPTRGPTTKLETTDQGPSKNIARGQGTLTKVPETRPESTNRYADPTVSNDDADWGKVHSSLLAAHQQTEAMLNGYPGNICNLFDSEKACHGIGQCAFWATEPGRLFVDRRGSCHDPEQQDFGFRQNRYGAPQYSDITALMKKKTGDSRFETYVQFHCDQTIRSVYWRLKEVVKGVLRYNHILEAWIKRMHKTETTQNTAQYNQKYRKNQETETTKELHIRIAKVKLRMWNLFRSFLNVEIDPWVVRALQSAAEASQEPEASLLHVQLHTVIFWARILAVAMLPPNAGQQPWEPDDSQYESKTTKFLNTVRHYAPRITSGISDARDKFSPRALFTLP